jgi:hypothetical protein
LNLDVGFADDKPSILRAFGRAIALWIVEEERVRIRR